MLVKLKKKTIYLRQRQNLNNNSSKFSIWISIDFFKYIFCLYSAHTFYNDVCFKFITNKILLKNVFKFFFFIIIG